MVLTYQLKEGDWQNELKKKSKAPTIKKFPLNTMIEVD